MESSVARSPRHTLEWTPIYSCLSLTGRLSGDSGCLIIQTPHFQIREMHGRFSLPLPPPLHTHSMLSDSLQHPGTSTAPPVAGVPPAMGLAAEIVKACSGFTKQQVGVGISMSFNSEIVLFSWAGDGKGARREEYATSKCATGGI